MTPCPNCHHDLPAGARFCASCGAAAVAQQAPGAACDPLIGQTFKGMYFVELRVGGGGMGDVYRARHVTLDLPVALKVLKRSLHSDPSVVQRFHREARAASRLRHPNVVHVTDFGQTEDGSLYMVMEYVAGRSLARVVAEEAPLAEQRIVRIADQILSALSEAHAGQILHRDLKPENVMLEARRAEPDLVKVLDFGIAKVQGPGEGHTALTQAGLVCGTPGYMSPEQWNGEDLDARSDLYAVGVMLYEMLTGRLPFEAQTPMEMLRKHLTEQVVPPGARRGARVSPDFEALVMRALSPGREARPASAEEMRAELLACVLDAAPAPDAPGGRRTVVLPSGAQPPGRSPTPGRGITPGASGARRTPDPTVRMSTPGQPPRRRARLAAAAVALAAVAVGAGAVLWVRGQRLEQERAADAARRAEDEARVRAEELARRAAAEEEVRRRARGEEEARRRLEEQRAAEDAARRAEEEARRRAAEGARRRVARGGDPEKRPGAQARAREERFESRSKLYAFPLPPPAGGRGVLSVNADPPGATVLVNGQAYGPAPQEVLVPAGEYLVRVRSRLGEQSKRVTVRAGTREPWIAIFTTE